MILYRLGGDTGDAITEGYYKGLTRKQAREKYFVNLAAYNDSVKKNTKDKYMNNYYKGMQETVDDYVIPAAKTVGSFNPVVSATMGAVNAYDAYAKGETGWGMAKSALTALPFAKYLKLAKPIVPLLKQFGRVEKAVAPAYSVYGED